MTSVRSILKGLFDDKEFYKSLIKIALPIVIQNFIGNFVNMVDTVMIGAVGETEIAAVGIANQFFFFFVLIAISIYSGCSIFISQFWGKEDVKNIRKIFGVGTISGVMVSIIFMIIAIIIPDKIISIFNTDPKVIDLGSRYLKIVAFTYIFTAISFSYSFSLRAIGETVLPMVISGVALLCNTIFNYVLIFGKFGAPAMGVEGAAIATLIARVVETILMVSYIYYKGGVFAAKIRELTDFTFGFVVKSYKTIIPVMLNEGCWGLGFLIYNVAYGRIGTQAVAAVQITNNITNLFLVVVFGMANASMTMVGNKVGAGEEEIGFNYANKFAILGMLSGIILGILLALTSPYMLKFFNVSDKVIYDSLIILYITSVILIVRIFNIILIVGILRGGGDAHFAFVAEASTMWFIGVPLSFLGAIVFRLEVYYVVGLLTIEEIVKCIICLVRLRSGKWIKNVIHGMS